jgi:DtxR family manganese transport transcriptional regulator
LGELSRADAYSRTRQDHASETAEDYVEAIADVIETKGICRAVDLAKQLGVSHVTVSKILSRLVEDDYVDSEPYRPIQLTSQGKSLAAKVRKRHDIVYHFLLSIGVDEKTAMVDSEGIEHHVSNKTLNKMSEFVDANFDPTSKSSKRSSRRIT